MSTPNILCIKNISAFLNVPVEKISLTSDKMPTINRNKETITGFINIIRELLNKSNSSLLGDSPLDKAQTLQWLEYCVTYLFHNHNAQNANHILKELNAALAPRTFVIGNYMTIADVALFYALQTIVNKLTHLEKEKYLNVSRWYDNLQQNASVRNKNDLVDFSTISLAARS